VSPVSPLSLILCPRASVGKGGCNTVERRPAPNMLQPLLMSGDVPLTGLANSQADSVAKPEATGTCCPPSSGRCRTGGAFVDRCDRAGYSMVPRLVVCQIHAQPRGASGVRAGHDLAGEGL